MQSPDLAEDPGEGGKWGSELLPELVKGEGSPGGDPHLLQLQGRLLLTLRKPKPGGNIRRRLLELPFTQKFLSLCDATPTTPELADSSFWSLSSRPPKEKPHRLLEEGS